MTASAWQVGDVECRRMRDPISLSRFFSTALAMADIALSSLGQVDQASSGVEKCAWAP